MDLFELGIVGLIIILFIVIIAGIGLAIFSDNNRYASALNYCGNETTLTHQYESYYCSVIEFTCIDNNCFPVNISRSRLKRECAPKI